VLAARVRDGGRTEFLMTLMMAVHWAGVFCAILRVIPFTFLDGTFERTTLQSLQRSRLSNHARYPTLCLRFPATTWRLAKHSASRSIGVRKFVESIGTACWEAGVTEEFWRLLDLGLLRGSTRQSM
jgi:hypothetical protein